MLIETMETREHRAPVERCQQELWLVAVDLGDAAQRQGSHTDNEEPGRNRCPTITDLTSDPGEVI